jgi:hypothetical protein
VTPTCVRCGAGSPRRIRRLCGPCYGRCERAGTLANYPCPTRWSDEVLDDYKVLRLRGCTQDEIALRLGMKVTSLRQALRRARIAGKQVAA